MPNQSKILAMGEEKIRLYLNSERRRKIKQLNVIQKKVRLKPKKCKGRKRVSRLGFFVTKKPTFLSSAIETNRRRH